MPNKPNLRTVTAEEQDLRARLEKAEESLREILSGEADALFVSGVGGAQLFTLKGADQSYRTLIENMSEGALTLTSAGLILYANRRFAEMLRTPLEKVIGSEIHSWFEPESRPVLQTLLRKDAVDNRREELALAAADGTQVPVNLSVSHLLLDEMPDSFCMVATDLTEQKRNEAFLAAEALSRAILEQAADAIVICNETGRIIRASKQAQALYGNNPLGEQFEHAFPLRQSDGTAFSPIGNIDTNPRQSVEARLEHNGRRFDFLVSVGHLKGARNKLLGSVVTLTDVTERKQAAQELQESDSRFREMAENIRDAFFLLDANGNHMVYISPAYEMIWGRTCESLYAHSESWMEAIHPEDRASVLENYKQGMSVGKAEDEFRIVRPDGSIRWVELRAFPVRDDAGKIVRIAGIAKDITDRKLAEETRVLRAVELEESQRIARIGSWVWEIATGIVTWSDGMNHVLARDRALPSPTFETVQQFYTPESWQWLGAAIANTIETGAPYNLELEMIRADGATCWTTTRGEAIRGADGTVVKLRGAVHDITEQKRAEISIKRLNRVYAMLSDINTLIVRVHDRDELFKEACRIAVEAGGFHMAWIGMADRSAMKIVLVASVGVNEKLQIALKDLLSSSNGVPFGDSKAAQALKEKRTVVTNDLQIDPTVVFGNEYVEAGVSSSISLPLIVADEAVGVLVLFAVESGFFSEEEIRLLTELGGDIAFAIDHINKQERLNYLAYYDVLTGLPNRTLFYDRLNQGVSLARRNAWLLAVLFVDLDNFKNVNDTLGQSIGDTLLVEVSRRLAACLRETDTVGRLDGDEFGIILPEIGSSEYAAMVAQKVIESCQKPYLVSGHELFISASAGITLFPDDAVDSDTLIRNADTAMYRAKDLGRNTYQFFTAEMNRNTQGKMKLEADLRYALGKGEFLLHYQPKVSCTTGKITGFEALLRWQHPERGLVGPDEFIPALEDTGLIVQVGAWVLSTACAQAQLWHDEGLGTPSIAVNVSGRQIQVDDLCETVQTALATSGLAPGHLELELTESQLMKDAEGIIGLLKSLKAMGVRISVDDFGTGYSSLAYLKRFPLDNLKVDRAFVRDIIADPNDVSITRAIITLAHSLKLKVIAEGVETEGQLGLLIANHCDEIQGYFFSRPLPVDQATALLRTGRSLESQMMVGLKRGRTLLLVDDEANILSALNRVLRRDGYNILTANNAAQGLELLASHPVDVIVSDQRMPGMHGVEFLRRVKTLHPETVRMVLSGYTDLQAVTDAINEGAIYKFLTKPWDDDILRANIEEAFRYKETADENNQLRTELALANSQTAVVNEQLQKLLVGKDL